MSLSDILPLEKAQCKSVKLLLCLLVLCIMSLEFKISGVLCNCLFCDLILPFCLPACPPVTSCWAPRAMFLWFCIASSHFCVFCTLVEWGGGGEGNKKITTKKEQTPPCKTNRKYTHVKWVFIFITECVGKMWLQGTMEWFVLEGNFQNHPVWSLCSRQRHLSSDLAVGLTKPQSASGGCKDIYCRQPVSHGFFNVCLQQELLHFALCNVHWTGRSQSGLGTQ